MLTVIGFEEPEYRYLILTNWKAWLTLWLILLNMACSHSGPGSTKGKDERTGPVFEKLNLFVAGEGGYFCYRIPALVVTTKGTILALCEARKHDCNDWDDIDIVMRRSFDNGKSWQ